MNRRTFAFALGSSALLCMATVAVWIRSFSAAEQVVAYHQHRYSLVVYRGHFQLERCTCLEVFTGEDGPTFDPRPYSEGWTFRFGSRPTNSNGECDTPTDAPLDAPSRPSQEERHELAAGPVWPVAALTAAAPLVLVIRRLRLSSIRREKIRRHLFNLLAGLSLLVCAASTVSWVRSFFIWDRGLIIPPATDDQQYALDFWAERGRVTAKVTRTRGFSFGTRPRSTGAGLRSDDLNYASSPANRFEFGASRTTSRRTWDYTTKIKPTDTAWILVLPHWFIAAIALVLPVVAPRRWWQSRHWAAGVCPSCGYDLRATRDRCPECGRTDLPRAPTR